MPRPATILFAVCAIMLLTVIYKQREGRILLSIEGRLTRSIENHKSHQAVVVFSSGLWWAKEIGQHWAVPDCTLQGNPVDCHFLSADHISGNTTAEGLVAHADVFVGHICWSNDDVPERFRQLPQVLFSMESERNNPCMRQQLADVEMTYKTCSQVWIPSQRARRQQCSMHPAPHTLSGTGIQTQVHVHVFVSKPPCSSLCSKPSSQKLVLANNCSPGHISGSTSTANWTQSVQDQYQVLRILLVDLEMVAVHESKHSETFIASVCSYYTNSEQHWGP